MSKKGIKREKKTGPVVKHGIYSWLRTGRINPSIRGFRKLQHYLKDLERDLIDLQGGPHKLTAAQEILIKTTIEAYAVVLLAGIYCKREGVLRPDKLKEGILELQPVLSHQFLAFMNTIRQNLVALGLDRKKVDDVIDLGTYLEKRALEKEEVYKNESKSGSNQPI